MRSTCPNCGALLVGVRELKRILWFCVAAIGQVERNKALERFEMPVGSLHTRVRAWTRAELEQLERKIA